VWEVIIAKHILTFLKGFFAKKKKTKMLPVGLLYIIRTYKVHRKRNNINIMGYVRFFSLLSSAHAFTSIISQANFNKNKTFLVQVWLVYNVL